MSEYIDIDGVPFNIAGCCRIYDMAPLIDASEQRGMNRLVPGTAGVITNPRRATETVVNAQLVIEGYRSFAGLAHPDTRTGLLANVAYLRKYVLDPTNTGDGTRTATLHLPDASTLAKPVQVLGQMSLSGDGPHKLLGVLRLAFPEGLFDLASIAP